MKRCILHLQVVSKHSNLQGRLLHLNLKRFLLHLNLKRCVLHLNLKRCLLHLQVASKHSNLQVLRDGTLPDATGSDTERSPRTRVLAVIARR